MNKYKSNICTVRSRQYLNYLIDPSFLGLNRHFVLLFQNNTHQTTYNQYFLPTVEIEDWNVMTDGKYFCDQPVKNDLRTYDSIQKNCNK